MILILAGTKDGRLVAKKLAAAGFPILASTVSVYGGNLLEEDMVAQVRSGPLAEHELADLLRKRKIRMVVDATHPFAVQARYNVRQACEETQVPLLRYERESLPRSGDGTTIIDVPHVSGAIEAASSIAGNIFLTTGSNTVEAFVHGLDPCRLAVRLLPDPVNLQKCIALGISPGRLIAMQGPFTTKLNLEMFRHFKAAAVISKESGKTGGLPEKIAAAAELQIPLILIGRPSLPEVPIFNDDQDLLKYIENHYHK